MGVLPDAPMMNELYGDCGYTANGPHVHEYLQEMNREANTIGSKANDTEISHLSVKLKEYIEKIRELIQNIE